MTDLPKPDNLTPKEWWLSVVGIVAVVFMGTASIIINHLTPEMKLAVMGLTLSLIAAIVGVHWRLPGGDTP